MKKSKIWKWNGQSAEIMQDCPVCYNKITVRAKEMVFENGEIKTNVVICLACGNVFNEVEWQP